jgi:hypothetical protein
MNALTTTSSSDTLLNFIERASRDTEFDLAKFEALLRMQREVVADQAKREFNAAMAHAQAEMDPVTRDARNAHTNSRYARLETVDAQMRPIYTRHGFSVRYGSVQHPREGWLRIKCTIAHAGGYFEEHHLDAALDTSGSAGKANKTPVQAVGSTVTYLRRYLLCMAFNIVMADEDNDGNGGSPERSAQRDRAEHRMESWGQPHRSPGQPRDTERHLGGDGLPDDLSGHDSLEDKVRTAVGEFGIAKSQERVTRLEQHVRNGLMQDIERADRGDLKMMLVQAMVKATDRFAPAPAQPMADGDDPFGLPPVAGDVVS